MGIGPSKPGVANDEEDDMRRLSELGADRRAGWPKLSSQDKLSPLEAAPIKAAAATTAAAAIKAATGSYAASTTTQITRLASSAAAASKAPGKAAGITGTRTSAAVLAMLAAAASSSPELSTQQTKSLDVQPRRLAHSPGACHTFTGDVTSGCIDENDQNIDCDCWMVERAGQCTQYYFTFYNTFFEEQVYAGCKEPETGNFCVGGGTKFGVDAAGEAAANKCVLPPPSPPPPSPPPPAPPCTVEMLKQRTAGDKSWPVACSQTTLGDDTQESAQELDLSGAHLSYGDFKDAAFVGTAINLNGAGLANADLSGATLTANNRLSEDATIDFSEANLANADLSGSKLSATNSNGNANIDFSEANLANADLSGSELSATANNPSYGDATIDFSEAKLTNADLSGSELSATAEYGDATIDFTEAKLANADLSGWSLYASGGDGGVYGDDGIIKGLLPPPPASPPAPPASPPSAKLTCHSDDECQSGLSCLCVSFKDYLRNRRALLFAAAPKSRCTCQVIKN